MKSFNYTNDADYTNYNVIIYNAINIDVVNESYDVDDTHLSIYIFV